MRAVPLILLLGCAVADVYMHNPRGSNNKLNEVSNNVKTNTRLFNSQNNNAGGYQVGDACEPSCREGGENKNTYQPNRRGAAEGQLVYYEGSILTIEWTNQHACGDNDKTHCQIILQYACEDDIRDGYTTDRIPETPDAVDDPTYGMHEDYTYYQKCRKRERNKGLYIADRNLNGKGAEATRQNNNPNDNNRRGFECQEERDYYPYWHPTMWKDIAILTTDTDRCAWYTQESENVRGRGECVTSNLTGLEDGTLPNNPRGCFVAGYQWKERPSHALPPPYCGSPPWGRDNHLGNTRDGTAATYNWTIPKGLQGSCVLRLRYNISTADVDPYRRNPSGDWGVDSTLNGKEKAYIKNNPYDDFVGFVDIKRAQPWLPDDVVTSGAVLRLAVNTDQVGRTFQDRSHTFRVVPRPTGIPDSTPIHNLNIRGRRGNIVQVYPAVEYDFVPNHLVVQQGDYVHIHWAHSDANPNNDGEGKQGTDRSNIVQIAAGNMGANTPAALHVEEHSLFTTDDGKPDYERIAYFAHLGQEGCEFDTEKVNPNDENNLKNCAILNRASATVDGGLVRMNKAGKHTIMSTRNNNFSNRSQKGIIEVLVEKLLNAAEPSDGDSHLPQLAWGALSLVIAGVVALVLVAGASARANPHRPWTQVWLVKKIFRVPDPHDQYLPGTMLVHLESPVPDLDVTRFNADVKEALALPANTTAKVSTEVRDDVLYVSLSGVAHPGSYFSELERTGKDKLRACGWAVASIVCIDKGFKVYNSEASKYNRRWVGLFVCVQAILFAWGFAKHRHVLLRHGNIWFPLAKGCGTALNFILAILPLPFLRFFLGALRSTVAGEYIDVDANISFHVMAACVMVGFSFIHVLAHIINFEWFRVRHCPKATCLDGCSCVPGPWGWTYGEHLRSMAGWSGVVLLVFFAAIIFNAMESRRRVHSKGRSSQKWSACLLPKGYDVFWYTHHLWIPSYVVLVIHAPSFYAWSAVPLLLLGLEKAVEYWRLCQEAHLVGATLVSRDLLHLRIIKPGFRYKSGQYVRIKVPELSPFVCHPFTISSSPHDNYLGVHIRTGKDMDWTTGLRDILFPDAVSMGKGGMSKEYACPVMPETRGHLPAPVHIAVDGPHSTASEEFAKYETVLLVGAGIGITPFISILKTCALEYERNQQRHRFSGTESVPDRCYFHWLVNDEANLQWFAALVGAIRSDRALSGRLRITTHMTGDFDLQDYTARLGEGNVPVCIQRTGRPNWASILKGIRDDCSASETPITVGVFLCGPDAIASTLSPICTKESTDRVRFKFMKENF